MRIAARHYSDERHLAEIDRCLARDPVAGDVLFERACCLEDLGRDDAPQAYLAVLGRDPRHFGALTNLGLMVRERGDLANARGFFSQALIHHPLEPIAHVNLGQVLFEQGETASAIANYQAALRLAPDFFAAHHGLALLYETAGDEALARRHLERAFAERASWTLPFHGTGVPLRVLLLVSGRGGDIVTHPFLDDRVMETTMFVPDGFRAGRPLPPHDVVFNGIGDADRCRPSLERAVELLAASAAPAINAPERVLATGRLAVAGRLAALTGVIAPRMQRLARGAIAAPALTADGWAFPLLVRAPGFQTGRHFERVDAPESLPATLERVPGDELLFIAYADTRGADGNWRKYRVLFVDGRPYPVHLAIGSDWKVHYFSADMAERADHRGEERAFLDDMRGTLGAPVMATLGRIARTLGLDYGGIDFTLDAAGNVVAFEANATMAIYPPPADPRWAYRRPAYAAAIAAVRGLIAERARGLGDGERDVGDAVDGEEREQHARSRR